MTAPLAVTRDDVEKLLGLLGHGDDWADNDTRKLVMECLYPRLAGMDATDTLVLELKPDDLYLIHKGFSPQAWGPGGREFLHKLAVAARWVLDADELGDLGPVGGEDSDLPVFDEGRTRDLLHHLEEETHA